MYSSLQQNKNTMFDDKEQVFCEEKKKGLLFKYYLRYLNEKLNSGFGPNARVNSI